MRKKAIFPNVKGKRAYAMTFPLRKGEVLPAYTVHCFSHLQTHTFSSSHIHTHTHTRTCTCTPSALPPLFLPPPCSLLPRHPAHPFPLPLPLPLSPHPQRAHLNNLFPKMEIFIEDKGGRERRTWTERERERGRRRGKEREGGWVRGARHWSCCLRIRVDEEGEEGVRERLRERRRRRGRG